MMNPWTSLGVDVEGWDDFGDSVVAESDVPSEVLQPVAGFDDPVVMPARQYQIG